MGKFVAVITSRDELGRENPEPFFTFNAKNKTEAKRIATQVSWVDFFDWENVIVIVDNVTKKKAKALWEASEEALDRYTNETIPYEKAKKYWDWRELSALENQISHWGNPHFNPNYNPAFFA